MALSGAFTGTTGSQYIFPTIKWSAAQSIDGNYSDVTVTLYYSRSNSGYTTSGTWSGGITIDGQWTAGSRYIEVSYQSGTLAMSATVRVYHNADGSSRLYQRYKPDLHRYLADCDARHDPTRHNCRGRESHHGRIWYDYARSRKPLVYTHDPVLFW